MQVLDDGRFTDAQGRTVDFKNTVIVITSNIGSQYLLDGIGSDGEISEEARQAVTELLRSTFRPEFLNRLDEIVFYKPLRARMIAIGLSSTYSLRICAHVWQRNRSRWRSHPRRAS